MKKKILAVLLSFCITIGSVICPSRVQAENENAGTDMVIAEDTAAKNYIGLDAEYHTQEQIREYCRNHPVKDMEAEYVTEPSVTIPYVLGELTKETLQEAQNMQNIYRYIAGVPEVIVTDNAQNYAQAAALVTAVNRKLSHTATHPEGMSDEMFDLASYGTFNCNLAALDNKLSSTVTAWMLEINGDADFGHRRQVLDYYSNETGFGLAQSVSGGYYSSVYVNAYLEEDRVISYPGQNQPLEYFGTGYAWTVVIPEKVDKSKVNVCLTDTQTGNAWIFNENTGNLRLDISGTKSACAIFYPQNINYRDGDKYRVEITGIDNPISYEVNMFLLEDVVPLKSIRFSMAAYYPSVGEDGYICKLKYTPENATNKIVTWTSSDSSIAEPVWSGTTTCRVIAKKEGTAIITATSEDGGHTASIEINVRPKADAVTLNADDITIGVGQSFLLEGTASSAEAKDTVFYKNDYDKNIISMEDTTLLRVIKITGKETGETYITAYADSNHDAQAVCHVKVVEPVYTTELRLDKTEAEIISDDYIQLNALHSPSNVTCKDIEWSSNDTNVARVENGKVTAAGNSPGKAIITAKASDGSGKEAKCMVTVYWEYEKAAAPVVLSYYSDKVTLRNSSGCEYSMDKENWQDSNEFTNLEPDHEYTFYSRKKASGYFKAGEISEGTTVRTRPEASQKPEATKKPETTKIPESDAGATKPPVVAINNCKHTNTMIYGALRATCTDKGYTGNIYCTDCGAMVAEGNDIAALGHDYTEKIIKKTSESEEGITTYTCSRCGDSYTKTVPKLSENSVTEKEESGEDNSKESIFTIENGVLKSYHGKSKSVIIPKGVKEIGTKAFYQNKTIEKVTIPTSVKKIGNYAFSESRLTNVVIPKGVTVIRKYAFSGCRKLKSVTIPNSVRAIGSSAFGGSGLKKVSVPEGVKKMGSMVFIACDNLESVALPGSLKKIPDQAFAHSANLKKVIIKKGCTTIGSHAFWYCIRLKKLTLPKGVKNIKERAFLDTAIKKITLPKSVTKIDNKYGIFGFCERPQTLKEITILNPKLKLDNMLGISMPPDTAMLYGLPLQKSITIKGYKKSTSEKFVAYINKHKSKYKRPAKFIPL